MKSFHEQSKAFLEQQKAIHTEYFTIKENIEQCGHLFPLSASFENTSKSYFMGIQGSISRKNTCNEFCFFDCCEVLTTDQLTSYLSLTETIRDTLTDASDPTHQYTRISLVLFVKQLPSDCQKVLRRFSSVKQYPSPLYGWSEIRVCVIEADSGQSIFNRDGAALRERVTNGIAAQEKKPNFFTRLFSR